MNAMSGWKPIELERMAVICSFSPDAADEGQNNLLMEEREEEQIQYCQTKEHKKKKKNERQGNVSHAKYDRMRTMSCAAGSGMLLTRAMPGLDNGNLLASDKTK